VSELTEIQMDQSLEKMMEVNENLKRELSTVLRQMQTQVNKMQEKRKQRAAQELEMMIMLEQKSSKLTKGQKKFISLKREVAEMWTVLE
jgi:ABC-type lipopolysaccharide export system ATPase subunit